MMFNDFFEARKKRGYSAPQENDNRTGESEDTGYVPAVSADGDVIKKPVTGMGIRQSAAPEELPKEIPASGGSTAWYNQPSYVDAVKAQYRHAERQAQDEVNRARRQRTAAAVGDIASMFGRMYAGRGSNGAWRFPQEESRFASADGKYADALRRQGNMYVDREGKLVAARMQEMLNRHNTEIQQQAAEAAARKDARDHEAAMRQQAFENQLKINNLERQERKDARDYELGLANIKSKERLHWLSNDNKGNNSNTTKKDVNVRYSTRNNALSFYLGRNEGSIDIPVTALNESNVSYVYSLIPKEIRDKAQAGPEGTKMLNKEEMLTVIGREVENNPDVRNALRAIADASHTAKSKNFDDEDIMPGI